MQPSSNACTKGHSFFGVRRHNYVNNKGKNSSCGCRSVKFLPFLGVVVSLSYPPPPAPFLLMLLFVLVGPLSFPLGVPHVCVSFILCKRSEIRKVRTAQPNKILKLVRLNLLDLVPSRKFAPDQTYPLSRRYMSDMF